MAITQLNQQETGKTDVTKLVQAVDKNPKGMAQVTLSEYDTDAAPVVKAGSVFECNGATFLVDNGVDMTPTGYSGITVSTAFYLYYDESAAVFIYSETAPTWSDALQGWYNGTDRALYRMVKDSSGVYYSLKAKMRTYSEELHFYSGIETTISAMFTELSGWVDTGVDYSFLPCSGHFRMTGASGVENIILSVLGRASLGVLVSIQIKYLTGSAIDIITLTSSSPGTVYSADIRTSFSVRSLEI